MKWLIISSLLLLGTNAKQIDLHATDSHWVAEKNFLTGAKEEVLSSLVGTKYSVKNLPLRKFTKKELLLAIPEDYSAVDAYPHCKTIGEIKTQSNCRSCWAVSVAAVFSDRLCIASKGRIDVPLSADELIGCCAMCGNCTTGCPTKAWMFTKQRGLVTGGEYASHQGCQPYSIKPCGPFSNEKCDKDIADTPKCHKHSCTNDGYQKPFNKDIHKTRKIYRVNEKVEDIQREIYIHGPVAAVMDVYEDFFNYSFGIYKLKDTSAKKIGAHGVKIVGWGTCKMCGMKYWIAANSWGSKWGEEGYFKIMRETNNVGFESRVSAGLPMISKKHKKY